MITVGNAQAFWGDLPSAAEELLRQVPSLDYLTMDYLAEVSMSILAMQRERNPDLGYPRDFVQVVSRLAAYWASGGQCRLIANAGGLNPMGCAMACRQVLEQQGCRSLKIGVVSGDNVLGLLGNSRDSSTTGDPEFVNLDDGRPLSTVDERLVTANAYLGCSAIAEALRAGADIVITGRVADPSMVLAACVHAFGWPLDDWDRLAQGTIAGHLIECGTQVTGGISTDWLSIDHPESIGFPVLEINSQGECVVTKPAGTGGLITESTVKEQLLYEIGDPGHYISPDVEVSFLDLQVQQLAMDRVLVKGGRGTPPPKSLKVSATYRDGFRAAGLLTIYGFQSEQKAQRAGRAILDRLQLAGHRYRDVLIECLGNASSVPLPSGIWPNHPCFETVLRLSVESESKSAVEAFSLTLMSLVTAGPQGTTGYAEGRPRVHSVFRYWPCLIKAERVNATWDLIETQDTLTAAPVSPQWAAPVSRSAEAGSVGNPADRVKQFPLPAACNQSTQEDSAEVQDRAGQGRARKADETICCTHRRLFDIAYGRSGDKGTGANVGIIARSMEDYPWLCQWLTAERVKEYFQGLDVSAVERYELPNLGGLNFLLKGALQRGIRNDAQGKALAQALLAMTIDHR